ncbi:MAG TPA: hypothetical protein VM123_01930 [archaeon]|nr:hypothetical protein [archaeon]
MDKTEKGLDPQHAAALAVVEKIKNKEAFSWRELFDIADKAHGGTQVEGKYTVKDAYDAMELGVNTWIKDQIRFDPWANAKGAKEVITELKEMLERLPTQTKRIEDQIHKQQYSTPPVAKQN